MLPPCGSALGYNVSCSFGPHLPVEVGSGATTCLVSRGPEPHLLAEVSRGSSAKCRSGFITLSPVLLQEQPTMVLLFERELVSWSLTMDERGRYKDFCGSDRQSVISYINGRTELYCSSLPYLSLPICPPYPSTPVKWCLPKPFITQGQSVILRPGA
jgi:hypothetical protein